LINSLARGLRILEAFGSGEAELANKDVARLTGIPKPTVSRLTNTLMSLHFLDQNAESGLYKLGKAALSLGFSGPRVDDIASLAMPYLEEFAVRHAVDVSLGVLDGTEVRAKIISVGTGIGLYPVNLGASVALDGTALGLGMLAGMQEGDRAGLLNQLRAKLGRQWQKAERRIARAMDEYAGQGYIVSMAEWSGTTNAIGAPLVFNDISQNLSICCGGLSAQISANRLDSLAPYFIGLISTITAAARAQSRRQFQRDG